MLISVKLLQKAKFTAPQKERNYMISELTTGHNSAVEDV
jgi:hypothetical protein